MARGHRPPRFTNIHDNKRPEKSPEAVSERRTEAVPNLEYGVEAAEGDDWSEVRGKRTYRGEEVRTRGEEARSYRGRKSYGSSTRGSYRGFTDRRGSASSNEDRVSPRNRIRSKISPRERMSSRERISPSERISPTEKGPSEEEKSPRDRISPREQISPGDRTSPHERISPSQGISLSERISSREKNRPRERISPSDRLITSKSISPTDRISSKENSPREETSPRSRTSPRGRRFPRGSGRGYKDNSRPQVSSSHNEPQRKSLENPPNCGCECDVENTQKSPTLTEKSAKLNKNPSTIPVAEQRPSLTVGQQKTTLTVEQQREQERERSYSVQQDVVDWLRRLWSETSTQLRDSEMDWPQKVVYYK